MSAPHDESPAEPSNKAKRKFSQLQNSEHGWVELDDTVYSRVRPLGQGSFGVVWLIQSQTSEERLVCKDIVYKDWRHRDTIRKSAERERYLLKASVHRNIVRFISFEWDDPDNTARIFMEYCEGGDLSQFCNGEISLTEEKMWKILFQLAAALAYCHHGLGIDETTNSFTVKTQWQTIIHRDIKPSNVLVVVKSEDDIWVKLCDFGFGKFLLADASQSGTYVGTRDYMAPEIQRDSAEWSIKADIYSLGRTIYKLTKNSKSHQISSLRNRCLSMSPNDRPSSLTLLEIAGHKINPTRIRPTDLHNIPGSPCNVKGWENCMFSTIVAVGNIQDMQMGDQNNPSRRLKLLSEDAGGLIKVTKGPWNDTPLHLAVERRNYLLAQRLLEAGAEVNAINWMGRTPLLLAAEQVNEKFLKLLLNGNVDPEILKPIESLAISYCKNGRLDEAAVVFLQLVETRLRILGKENLDTLRTMNGLAEVYRDQGRLKEAEDMFLQAMGARVKVLGKENPDSLCMMGNLAETYRIQGRLKEAEDMFFQLVGATVRALGKENPRALWAMDNLAETYRCRGRLREAGDMFLQVMEARVKLLGKKNPNTLWTINGLAETYRLQGRLKEAEDMYLQVIEARVKVLGKENPDTLWTMNGLAETYRLQGRLKEAEDMLLQLMEATAKVLGKENPHTLWTMDNLAETYRLQGRLKEAEDMYLQVMETTVKVLGKENPNTLRTMNGLAETYRLQGRLKEAEDMYLQVIEARVKVLGKEDPDTLWTMNGLAETYRLQGRLKEAEDIYLQVMEATVKVLGKENPDTLWRMNDLARMYRLQGRLKEADDMFL